MLFNSYEFIFLFMPVVLLGFHFIRRVSIQAALGWLILVSLVFYGWWRPVNLLIIIPSIITNYAIAKALQKLAGDRKKAAQSKLLLAVGVTANLLFLGYFKYLTFFQSTSNHLFGTDFVLTYIILPLGISFITFQKIAFLVDVHGGNIKAFRFREFALFVLFFPQLIAGPIVHFREMMPQYLKLGARVDRRMLAAGLSLFCMGLFKKVILADGIAMHVSPIYNTLGADGAITMVTAWVAALGFTLQIYFDFSGYSDMAAGLALAIGVRLPINFDSPLKTSNIIDFWGRWHITLTRFLTAYVYNPIALNWTRKRLKKGKPGFSPARPNVPAFIQLLALPTFITMLLSGLWHGAGYTFIIWGGLHGIYLCINHGWRLTAPGWFKSRAAYETVMGPLGFVITFFSVTVAMVWFRAADVPSALAILQGMTGANGIGLPAKLATLGGLDSFAWIIAEPVTLRAFMFTLSWVVALLLVALVMPNTYQLMQAQEPVLGYQPRDELSTRVAQKIQWRPGLVWFVAIGIILATTMMRIGGQSEFLYWQF